MSGPPRLTPPSAARPAMLVDAHAHLDRYPDELLAPALAEIRRASILTIATAMDLSSYERAKAIAARCPLVVPAFGIHPWNAPVYSDELRDQSLRRALDEALLFGEIGLDRRFVPNARTHPAQRAVFELFLAAARDQGKLVNLHTSGAEEEVCQLLERFGRPAAIVHWYSGPADAFARLLELGALFTVGVEVHFSPHIQALARIIPDDRLLTETDNPEGMEWLTGTPGMPLLVTDVVGKLAELRGTNPEGIVQTVEQNLFRLMRANRWLAPVAERILGEAARERAA